MSARCTNLLWTDLVQFGGKVCPVCHAENSIPRRGRSEGMNLTYIGEVHEQRSEASQETLRFAQGDNRQETCAELY